MAISPPVEIPLDEGPDRDRALVLAYLSGDPAAFQDLVLGHYQSMLGHAYRRLRDERAAEDAVQDALLRAYRSLSPQHVSYRLGPWLHRILDNVCTDEGLRRRRESEAHKRLSTELGALRPVGDESPDLAFVAAAIAALPPNYREVLVLRDVMELDYADVATRAGITEDNARARVSRARAALRKLVTTTASLGAVVGRALRRGAISTPRVIRSVSTTAGTLPPDLAAAPARSVTAASTLCLTAVAVATVGIPALVSSPPAAPVTPRSGDTTAVIAGPQVHSRSEAVAVAAVQAAVTSPSVGQASTTSTPPATQSTTTLPKTVGTSPSPILVTTLKPPAHAGSTTTLPSRGTVLAPTGQPGSPLPAPSGTAIPTSDVSAPNLSIEPAKENDRMLGTGTLVWPASRENGPIDAVMQTPPSACGSVVGATLNLVSPKTGQPGTVSIQGQITGVSKDAEGTTYSFVGQAAANGISDSYQGKGWAQGTIRFHGSVADLVSHIWGAGSAPPPVGPGPCAAVPAPETTTTTAAPGGSAGTTTSTTSTTTPPPSTTPSTSAPAANSGGSGKPA